MELQEAIKERRSIKKYLPTPVEHEKVSLLINAASLAPSSGNIQNWAFVLVTDKDKQQEIAKACLDQLWMAQAPLHIVVCAKTEKIKEFYGQKADDYSHQNCSAAIQNILLTATELGLGSCWVGAVNERIIRKTLSMEDSEKVIAVITIGYKDEDPKQPARTKAEFFTFFDKWGETGQSEDSLAQTVHKGLQEK